MAFLDRGGRRLRYEIDGPEGAPVLVLGNSIASDLTIWNRVAADLSADFRVLCYDMPGHGSSDPAPEADELPYLAQEPLALLDALGIGAAHFAGISLGAMVAGELALLCPDRCLSLIYCNAITEADALYAGMWRDRIALTQSSILPVVEPTVSRWLTLAAPAALRQKTGEMIAMTSLAGFHAAAQALTGLSLTKRLAALECPKLFVAGEQDQAAPKSVMQAQAEEVGAAFTVLSGAAHLSALEQPANMAALLRGWLLRSGL